MYYKDQKNTSSGSGKTYFELLCKKVFVFCSNNTFIVQLRFKFDVVSLAIVLKFQLRKDFVGI